MLFPFPNAKSQETSPCKSKLGVDEFWAPTSLLSNLIPQTHGRDLGSSRGWQRSRTLPSSIRIYCAEGMALGAVCLDTLRPFNPSKCPGPSHTTNHGHRVPAAFNLSSAQSSAMLSKLFASLGLCNSHFTPNQRKDASLHKEEGPCLS